MRTDLYPFEAALCRLLQPDWRVPPSVPADEWPALLQLADREHVAPLVYAAIEAIRDGTVREAETGGDVRDGEVPAAVRETLAQSHRHAAAATAEAYAQLAGVLRAFRSEGLEAMLLKGPALARFTYQDAALRPFSDLDLLVRPKDVEAAHLALRRAGYAIAGEAPTATDLTWRHARGYYDPERRRIPVDLHWRYAGFPLLAEINYADVFARARPVPVGDERALIPAPEDMLVALGIHFQRELWYGQPRLRYLRDVAAVAHRHPVDWQRVVEIAQETPLVRSPLYLVLGAAAELLDAAIPPETLVALRPPGRAGIAGYLLARVCRNALRQERPTDAFLQVALMRWLDADSLAGYLGWISALIFVPRGLASSRRRWLHHFWQRTPPGDGPDG